MTSKRFASLSLSALLATAALAACERDIGTSIALADGRRLVPAPIESAEIVVRESAPPEYSVRITSALPNGCAQFERIDVLPNGTILELKVWNTLPADEKTACTMLYGTTSNTVSLGRKFEAGRTYDVRINGQSKVSFTPQ
jgi:hypothetical protein